MSPAAALIDRLPRARCVAQGAPRAGDGRAATSIPGGVRAGEGNAGKPVIPEMPRSMEKSADDTQCVVARRPLDRKSIGDRVQGANFWWVGSLLLTSGSQNAVGNAANADNRSALHLVSMAPAIPLRRGPQAPRLPAGTAGSAQTEKCQYLLHEAEVRLAMRELR